MEREVINPWTWQDRFGFVQATKATGAEQVLHCAAPEFLPGDRCRIGDRAFARTEPVEAGREQRLDRRRQLDELRRGAHLLGEHRYELLGV